MSEGYQPKPGGIPNDQLKPPRGALGVTVTQAKYFYCIECDGQKVFAGFQTLEELRAFAKGDKPADLAEYREANE